MNILEQNTLQQYLENNPKSSLYSIYAEQLLKSDNLEKAEEICRAGLENHTNSAEGYFVLAEILLKQGKLPQAIRQLQNAIRFQPGFIQAHKLLLLLGKENLSLTEIDISHKTIETFENNLVKIETDTTEFLPNQNIPSGDVESQKDIEEDEFLKKGQETVISEDHTDENELDLDDYEPENEEDFIDDEKPNTDNNHFELNLEEESTEQDVPEIAAPEDFSNHYYEETTPDNDYSYPEDEDLDQEILNTLTEEDQRKVEETLAQQDVKFELDLGEENSETEPEQKEFDEADNQETTTSMIMNYREETVEESEEEEIPELHFDEETVPGLSIQPVEDHPDETEEENEKETESPEIPEFKSTLKKEAEAQPGEESREKINLNIPIPTLTFVEVLKKQKLYDQALEILDILEKRSSDKEKIIQQKEEIIQLKAQDNY
jgi:tetratricopeptide (TPR) repeat protein